MRQIKSWGGELVCVLLLLALYLAHQGSALHAGYHFEEARDATAYAAVANGQVFYRDFEWLYGPLAPFLYSSVVKHFGDGLLTLRKSYFFFACAVLPLAYLWGRLFLPVFWSCLFAFLSVAVFQFPSHSYNHIFLPIGLLAASFALVLAFRRRKTLWFGIAGVLASIPLLAKPVVTGSFLYGALFLFLLFEMRRQKIGKISYGLAWLSGSLLLPLSFLIWFIYQTVGLGKEVLFPPFWGAHSMAVVEQAPKITTNLFLQIFVFPLRDLWYYGFRVFRDLWPPLNRDGVRLYSLEVYYTLIRSYYFFLIFAYLPFRVWLAKKESRKYLPYFDFALGLNLLLAIEGILTEHFLGKQYALHPSLYLTCFFLFLIEKETHAKRWVKASGVAMAMVVASYTFFYLPLKNKSQNTESLSLPRMNGVLVAPREKQFLEALFSHWKSEGTPTKVAVLGYVPHLSYLSGVQDIFSQEQYLFLRLMALADAPPRPEVLLKRAQVESHTVYLIEKETPKFIALLSTEKNLLKKIEEHLPKLWAEFKNYSLAQDFFIEALQGGPLNGRVLLFKRESLPAPSLTAQVGN